jgi:hypothetical protein
VKEEAAREKDQVREPEPAETEPTARAGDGAEAKRTTRTGATTSTGGARAPTRRARSTDGGANGEPAGGQGSAGERSAGDRPAGERSAGDRPAGTPKRSKQNRRPRKKHGRR